MAIFRKVHVSFWKDEFIESLTTEQKYFYLYLMTNDRTKQCGIYEITVKQISYDTGYNEETVRKLIKFFVGKGKIRYSESTKEVALKNWGKYNDSTSPKVKVCIDKELSLVKDRVLIEYLYSTDTHSQEEQEEEQEEEKEENSPSINFSFDDFWTLYDYKVGEKVKLKSKWEKLTNKEREDAMKHIPLYKIEKPDKQFRKHPSTYLNNKSWNDEVLLPTSNSTSRQLTPYEIEMERKRNEAFARTQGQG